MNKLLLLLFTLTVYISSNAQITFDGNMNEGNWGMPLATSTGGPSPCASSNTRLNSLYAAANDSNILIGLGGIIQNGHPAILFIDSKTGGVFNAVFSRSNAPACLQNLPAGTTFDAGFSADYCLIISNNTTTTTATIQLFPVSAIATNLTTIAGITPSGTTLATGCKAGIAPSTDDFTKGYEISMPRTLLDYTPLIQPVVKFMVMGIDNDGNLTNQFLTHADASAINCFGKGTNGNGVQFQHDAAINPVEFNPSRSLPIDYTYIRAFQVGQAIKIFWASATEREMQEYQVERSGDAMQYGTIGRVLANGFSSNQTQYEFADVQPLLGKSYYRVKAIDRNGRSTYSSIVKMQFGRVDNSLTIYPNPVKDQINLQIVGLKPDTYHLEIFNDLGQRLIEKTIVYTGGYGLQQIPLLPNMKKGPYRLLLRNKAFFYKQNFLVHK